MSLALSTLIYEWRRYLAAIIALAFSGLLIISQVGLFAGIASSITATIDRSRADIMVMAPQSESLMGDGQGLPARVLPLIYLNSSVVDVKPLDGTARSGATIPRPARSWPTPSCRSSRCAPSPAPSPCRSTTPRRRAWP